MVELAGFAGGTLNTAFNIMSVMYKRVCVKNGEGGLGG